MQEKESRKKRQQHVCTVCGFDYVADFASWQEKFNELLARDPLADRDCHE